MIRIGDELVPLRAVDLHGKRIGIEAGTRHQRQNLAIPRVHGNNGAVSVAQGKLGRALQIVVNGEPQILPGDCVLDSEVAYLAPVAIDDHFARSILPAQQFVVRLLHARLAHYVARLVVGETRITQIVLTHLAHVADQMRCISVSRVKPALLVDRLQLGQFITMRRNKRLLVGSYVLLDGDGLVAGLQTVPVQCGPQLIRVEIQAFCDQRQIRIHVSALFAHQEAGDGRVVVDDEPVLAVEEFAARRQDRLLPNPVLFSQSAVVLCVQHLQSPQARGQGEHHQ